MNEKEIEKEAIYIHAWNLVTCASFATLRDLHKAYGSFERAWHIKKPSLDPNAEYQKFRKKYPDITLITRDDPRYPPLLKEMKTAPFSLYIEGNHGPHRPINSENSPKNPAKNLSIVGTRQPSPYGILQTQKIIQHVSAYPLIIISGLARGIDTLAHETALLEGLSTWAVIGHGHTFLPSYQRDLIQQILENGCIISEYPPEIPPEKFRYPERNRIIAGLSEVTVVTEAPKSSGANITAKLAREENREVFALCADIDRHDCQGNLDLIEECIATPLTSFALLEQTLHCVPREIKPHTKNHSSSRSLPLVRSAPPMRDPQLQAIVDALNYKKITAFGEIMDTTHIQNVPELLEKLTTLEIDGIIESLGGGYILTIGHP